MKKESYQEAKKYFEIALTKEIATKTEEKRIKEHIAICNEKIKI
jgi:hypothetical protein